MKNMPRLIIFAFLGIGLAWLLTSFQVERVSAQAIPPSVADLESLLASPIARYLSGSGTRALRIMTGQVPRTAQAPLPVLPTPQIVVGPEVRVNNPTGDQANQTTQSETSVAVFGQNILVGFNDSSVCCAQGATRFSSYATSQDGGVTFTDRGVIPAPTGIDLLGDPAVTVDSTGNFYYATLAARGTLPAIGVAKSTDGGLTFPTIARADINPTQTMFQDKEYLVADSSSTSPFRGNLYITWGSFAFVASDIDFARSTDGGQTWTSAIGLNGGGPFRVANGAVPAVDPDGRIYVVWEDFRPGLSTGAAIGINRSDNGGLSFAGERKVADVVPVGSLELCGTSPRMTVNGSIRVNDFPAIAVDKSNGSLRGNVYVAWNDNRNGNPDILFSRSTDRGTTWSPPIRVNDNTNPTDQFMPWMTVDPSGLIYVMWYDRRLDPTNNRLIDVFVAVSADGGRTFLPNGRVTSTSFDVPPLNPNFDPAVGACYMGDYNGVTADATTVYFTWGDNRDLVGSRPDPDVFFRKVAVR